MGKSTITSLVLLTFLVLKKLILCITVSQTGVKGLQGEGGLKVRGSHARSYLANTKTVSSQFSCSTVVVVVVVVLEPLTPSVTQLLGHLENASQKMH